MATPSPLRHLLPVLALLLPPLLPAQPSPPEHVLFAFDDQALPFQKGLRLQMVGFQEHLADSAPANIVLQPGPPGSPDSLGCYYYGSVQQVGDELWMWYLGYGDRDKGPPVKHLRFCFAKSRDGKTWEKPVLNLADYGGSRANNLTTLNGRGFDGLVESAVLYEPDEPNPDRRFKMIFERKAPPYRMHLAVATSADGVRWTEPADNPRGPACEMSGLIKWRGAYYASAHADGHWVPGGGWARALDTIVSYDFEHWYMTPALGFRRDPLPPRPVTAAGTADGEQVHLGAGLWNRGNVIIGFYGMWHGSPTDDRGLVSVDLGLVVSHDALHYTEPVPDFRIVTAKENLHSWPAVSVAPPALAQGQGFVNLGDQTLVWYGIWNRPADGIRLATWQRDRLGYLAPWQRDKEPATLTSEPLDTGGKPLHLLLNADGLGEYSHLKVALLDEQFRPLPGFALSDSTGPTASGLRQRATWKGGDTISHAGPIRIRVDFTGIRPEDLRLYAMYLSPVAERASVSSEP